MAVDLTFPENLIESIEPKILFTALPWVTEGKKTQSVTNNKDTYFEELVTLPMSNNGLTDSITNSWDENAVRRYTGLTGGGVGSTAGVLAGGIRSAVAEKVKELTGIFGLVEQFESGKGLNDFLSLTYGGAAFRQFSFTYELIPSSPNESIILQNIVKAFKRNSLPSYDTEYRVLYPSIWKIDIISPDNTGIFSIDNCVCTSVVSGVYGDTKIPFYDGSPPKIDLELTFKELNKLSKEDYAE